MLDDRFKRFWAPLASIIGAVLLVFQLAQAFTGNRTLVTGLLIMVSLIAVSLGMWNYAFAKSVIPGMPRYPYHWLAKIALLVTIPSTALSGIYNLTILNVVPDCCGLVATLTIMPTALITPSPTPNVTSTSLFVTETDTSKATLTLAATSSIGEDPERLVFVPAGQFMMGSNNGDDEKPIHKVYLDAFWIDQTEVTNSMYDQCVRAGQCKPPQFNRSAKRDYYYGNPEFDNYPVILVSWDDASTYCAWVNRRLPTEAEWEKAARGIDGRIYPWGGVGPGNTLLNYNANVGDTTEVGKYPDGKSPYGAFDMAGNVWEWVADWYGANYYSISPTNNPKGPFVGDYHVLRGGSWYSPEEHITVTTRETKGSSFRDDIIGFRCAKSGP